jgi:type I restriction enzyme S subunit
MISKKVILSEVCNIKTGKKDVNEGNPNGKYPFFTCAKEHTFSDTFSFDCEAILIAGNGAVGQTTYFNGKFEAYQRTYILSDFKDIEPKLLLLILQDKLMNHLSSMVLGNTIPYIKLGMIEKFEIDNLPNIDEQQHILAKLDAVFAEIDKAKIKNETKLIEIQNFLGNFIDKELKKLSLLFPTAQLNEFVEGVEYGSSKKCFKDGKYPVLRMGNIKNGQFILDDLIYTDDKNEAEKYKVRKNDVFFNRTNSPLHVGKTALSDEEFEGLFAGYLIRINPKKEKLHSKFLNYYLNSPSIRKYGYSVMTSSVNQANINGSKLKQYPFISADIKTQSLLAKKFANIQTLTIQLEKLIKKTLENYNHLKSKIANQELRIKII